MLTYIAAYDGTDASRAAVRFAVDLARAEDAQVIAAHVFPDMRPTHLRSALPAADIALQEDARNAGQAVLDGLEADGVSRRVLLCGAPARALHDLAVAERASLLSVGVTHHEHLGRLIPGSVGAKLLHGAPCPVAAVPATAANRVSAVGVAYDGAPESRRALAMAARLASTTGARLVLIGAIELPPYAGPALATAWDVEPAVREALEDDMREAAHQLAVADAETVVVDGPAGPAVAEAARDRVDLLVTGSRGYGPLRTVLVGSVSRHLVDNAHCPVLVVPRTSESEVDSEPKTAVARA